MVPTTIQSDFANAENPYEHYRAVLDQFNNDIQIAQIEVICSKQKGDEKKISK